MDPILPFKPDSVCPPGCFWLGFDQDKSCSLLLSVECASAPPRHTHTPALLFNKTHLEQGKAELTKAGLHLDFELDALMCVNNVIYTKRKFVHDTDTHSTHLQCIFFSTQQNMLIHHINAARVLGTHGTDVRIYVHSS